MYYVINKTYNIYLSNEYNSNTYYLTPNMSSKIIQNDTYHVLQTENTCGEFNGITLTIKIELLYYEQINTFKINNNDFSNHYTSIGYDEEEMRYTPENNTDLLLYTSSKISFTFDTENNSIIKDTEDSKKNIKNTYNISIVIINVYYT